MPASRRRRRASAVADADEVGERVAGRGLHALAQHGDAAGAFDRAGMRRRLAGDHAEQRRLADAVAADKAGAVGAEDEVEIFEKRPAVRRCQRDGVERDDGRGMKAWTGDRNEGKGAGEGMRRGLVHRSLLSR